ncbi:hypothetical protein GQ57_38450 [Burkholderia sp. MSh2]|nr:hypothetical protein GQ57_38450 [Burkholderia sp. MSh2]
MEVIALPQVGCNRHDALSLKRSYGEWIEQKRCVIHPRYVIVQIKYRIEVEVYWQGRRFLFRYRGVVDMPMRYYSTAGDRFF